MTLSPVFSRLTFTLFLLQSFYLCSAQTKISGRYMIDKNYTDIYLNLFNDSTFTYGWRGHMWVDKSNGLYKTKGDTIFLAFRPFRGDTSYFEGKPVILYDEVLHAIDRPDTLFYKKDKLYRVKNGLVVNRTKRGRANFIKTKGWRKYFRRQYYFFGPYISRKRKIHYLQKFDEGQQATRVLQNTGDRISP